MDPFAGSGCRCSNTDDWQLRQRIRDLEYRLEMTMNAVDEMADRLGLTPA